MGVYVGEAGWLFMQTTQACNTMGGVTSAQDLVISFARSLNLNFSGHLELSEHRECSLEKNYMSIARVLWRKKQQKRLGCLSIYLLRDIYFKELAHSSEGLVNPKADKGGCRLETQGRFAV